MRPSSDVVVACLLLLLSSFRRCVGELDFSSAVTPSGEVVIRLEARTTGYIGVGFSIDGRIPSSDVVMAWVDSNGKGRLFDGHGVQGRATPEKDSIQNYKLLDAFQNDTHTVIKMSRAWDTCDRKGDVAFVNDTMRLIWTINEFDPGAFGWGNIEWSGPRSILIGSPTPQEKLENIKHWDVLAQELTLPGESSFHWCKIYKVPLLSRKQHIIGYTPMIELGHSALVAKMVLYECLGGTIFEKFGSHPGSPCHDSHAPKEWKACHTPVIVWATGSQGQFLPEHVGLPMAEGEGKSTYFMLEIHYDNPALQRVRDNSGLRLYYSSELRKYDSSILATGITPTGVHIIPPKQIKFTSRGYCDNQCTNLEEDEVDNRALDKTLLKEDQKEIDGKMFPEAGIRIVSVSFHTHSAGRQVQLRHIREGKELQVIAQDRYFDPGYQQAKQLMMEAVVLPGDDLVVECSYTTVNRTSPILGGHAIKEETCMAYILYYPRTALASCTSMTAVEFFFQTFGIEEFYDQNMEEVENIVLKHSGKQVQKIPRPPMQSLFFHFSEKQGFNIDNKNPYINIDATGDDESNVFSQLVIDKPDEFQNKSFMSHLKELPWQENLFTRRVEEILNEGKYQTFCRLQDDTPAMPSSIYNFPNVTVLNETHYISNCRREHDGGFNYIDNSCICSSLPTNLLVFTSAFIMFNTFL